MQRPRSWVDIHLSALEQNIYALKKILPLKHTLIAVIKANAYGHGLIPIAQALSKLGIGHFAVANAYEGIELRESGFNAPILVFGDPLPTEAPFFIKYRLTATISCLSTAEHLDSIARRSGQKIPYHLKIDTGMGRMGIWHEEAAALYTQLIHKQNLEIKGLFTHFALSDIDPKYTQKQRALFFESIQRMPGLKTKGLLIHSDNSAGLLFSEGDERCNATRIGRLLMGILPHEEDTIHTQFQPILSFHTRILLVKELPKGMGISYYHEQRLRRKSRIAIIAIGNADGLRRKLSKEAYVLIQGHPCPILGNVCMDQCCIDVTDLPRTAQIGEIVTLIGQQGEARISVHALSRWAKIGPLECLCSIGNRIPRFYL